MSQFSTAPKTFAITTLIAVTTACGPSFDYADDSSRVMSRAQYASVTECARDWGRENECELKQSPGVARPTVFGPYYAGGHFLSASGEAKQVPSTIHSQNITSTYTTPSAVYTGSRYSGGSRSFSAARTASIASSRGGMVSTSHASSSGG